MRRASASGRATRELAALFKVLGSPTRLRLLQLLLRDGEACVGDVARGVRMTPQAVSNQLRRMARLGVVSSRREGAEVHYRVSNPCVPALLDKGLCLIEKECEPRRRPLDSGPRSRVHPLRARAGRPQETKP